MSSLRSGVIVLGSHRLAFLWRIAALLLAMLLTFAVPTPSRAMTQLVGLSVVTADQSFSYQVNGRGIILSIAVAAAGGGTLTPRVYLKNGPSSREYVTFSAITVARGTASYVYLIHPDGDGTAAGTGAGEVDEWSQRPLPRAAITIEFDKSTADSWTMAAYVATLD